LFHEPINYEQKIKWDIEKVDDYHINFVTYKKPKKYIVTPINVSTSYFYIDYIGFGGFKCYVESSDKPFTKIPDCIKPFLNEIDYSFSLMIGCNEFKEVHGKLPWNSEYDVYDWSNSYYTKPLEYNESSLWV
jgi:hypothetical protein